jgi:hypothetical protein
LGSIPQAGIAFLSRSSGSRHAAFVADTPTTAPGSEKSHPSVVALREIKGRIWSGPILGCIGVGASWMQSALPSVPAGIGLLARPVVPFQPKEHMMNIRSVVGLIAIIAIVSSVPTFAADVAADAAQVARQAASIPALQQSAATAAGYKAADLEVRSTAHQITITVVNSKLNVGLPVGRSSEASKIMQALEKSIAGRAEFGQVMMIHLDYVSRQGTDSKIIQGFDFNKSPSGSFVPHTT